jgi:hypothetical protein
VQRDDLLVERALFGTAGPAEEAEAEKRDVLRRVVPAIDADQAFGLEAVRRFLHHLAAAGGDERLAGVEMPCRLVEDETTVDAFLDEKKASVALDDGRDRHRRLPHHG